MKNAFDVTELAKQLQMPPILCNEALCQFILSNEQFQDHENNTYFLRGYENYIFKVTNPLLRYIIMPIIKQQQIEDVTHMCEKITITDNMNFINEFRYMPMKQKIILLEQCIAENKTAILEHLEALYVEIDGVTYHTLLYKDVENSYTSTHPVPKKLLGKTRMFKNGQWQPIQSIQEERYLYSIQIAF